MKVSHSKTEYICVNERDSSGTVRLQGVDVKRTLVQLFRAAGNVMKVVKKLVQEGWSTWRKVSGEIYDKRVAAKDKGKIYKRVVRPAMLFGLETVAMTKRQGAEVEVVELKVLRFFLGVTSMDRIRNKCIRETGVGRFGDKSR